MSGHAHGAIACSLSTLTLPFSIVEEQLGCPRESVFSFWEDKPIGCASIGQVHRATLTKKHGGTKVVVKVQNPSAERTFVGDVFALRVLMDTFMPQFSVAFDEIQKQFATEFDYRGECRNAIEIRDNLRKGGFTNIIVPEVYPELCTQKIMVMEEIAPSITLHDALDKQAEQLAQAAGMTKKEYTDRETARVEQETMALAREGKTPSSVSSREYDKYIMLQVRKREGGEGRGESERSEGRAERKQSRASESRPNAQFAQNTLVAPFFISHMRFHVQRLKQTMYNWTVGWVWAADVGSGSIVVPLNAALLIDDLLYVHGHEVLIDGCFNGDPHPGNVLCAGGKLALIDYGQVKRIGEKERMDMSKMVLLVSAAIKVDPRVNRDVDMEVHRRARKSVANHGRAIGMETEKMLEDTFYDLCVVYYGRMDAAFLYPRNVIQWSDWMQERDPLGNIDKVDYSVMLTTATMMLRGLGEMLQQYRNLADVWKPIAQKALKEKGQLEAVEDEIKAWGGKP